MMSAMTLSFNVPIDDVISRVYSVSSSKESKWQKDAIFQLKSTKCRWSRGKSRKQKWAELRGLQQYNPFVLGQQGEREYVKKLPFMDRCEIEPVDDTSHNTHPLEDWTFQGDSSIAVAAWPNSALMSLPFPVVCLWGIHAVKNVTVEHNWKHKTSFTVYMTCTAIHHDATIMGDMGWLNKIVCHATH